MFSSISALILLIALYGLLKIFGNYLVKHPLDTLPGPPPSSVLFGNVREFRGRRSRQQFAALADKYGPALVLRAILGQRVLLIHDPQALHAILVKDQQFLQKGIAPSNFSTVLFGPGLLSTREAQHRRQRKYLNPVFSVSHLREMTDILYTVSHKIQAALQARIPADGSADIVDMNRWNGRATLEMLGQAALGYSFDNSDEELSDAYGESLKAFVPALARARLIALIVDKLSYVLSDRNIRRLLRHFPLRNFRELMKISDTMARRSREIIEEKKAVLQKGRAAMLGEGKDLMSVCLRANMSTQEAERMTDEELHAQMSTFMFAGMDTTSNALSRMMHFLAEHPAVQEKLRAEILEATGGGHHDLDYDGIMKLRYLDAVCRETLRVQAPVALTARTATKDLAIPLSTPICGRDGQLIREVVIPRGTIVIPHFQGANADKTVWGDEAEDWIPERWLAPLPEAVEGAHFPGIYSNLMTFSAGPRSCIGFKLAELEMKIFVSVILSSFTLELTDSCTPIVWNSSAVVYPTMGEESTWPEMLLKVRTLNI